MEQIVFQGEGARKAESGFSLLELLLVVGVGALLLLAGIATYRLVTQGNDVNDAVRVLTTIKSQTQKAYQGQNGYGAAGTDLVPILVAMQAFPAGVLDSTDTPRHPWGDTIVIESSTVTGDTRSFDLTFTNVPSDACINLGTTFDSRDTDFLGLSVGATNFASTDIIDPNALVAPCTAAALVNMVWTFR
ncbi:MAG: prepilin-type N-terminal cleavage/methylation domain-containing protein [Rhodospirillales bacterium]|nr:prepilin-type N-terminal cleavage/methylation domain-containing protein [Rhodospirillales bacterium]